MTRPDRESEAEKLEREVAVAMMGSGLFEHISGKWGVIWKAEQLPHEYQFRSDAIAHIDRLRARAAIALVVERGMSAASQVARENAGTGQGDGALAVWNALRLLSGPAQ